MKYEIDGNIISNAHRKVIHQLVDFFEKQNLLYQFTGGFSSNLFGSVWKLQDIDIETDLKSLYKIQEALKPYVIKEIHRYSDEEFQIWLLQLQVENIKIDINAVEDFIIKPNLKIETKIENAILVLFDNRLVRTQSLEDIIKYKKLLNRHKDLEELTKL